MSTPKVELFDHPLHPNEKSLVFEQHKILIDSIKKSNEVREAANNFWTTINTLVVSAISYIKDTQTVEGHHKPTVVWGMIILGLIVCLSWTA